MSNVEIDQELIALVPNEIKAAFGAYGTARAANMRRENFQETVSTGEVLLTLIGALVRERDEFRSKLSEQCGVSLAAMTLLEETQESTPKEWRARRDGFLAQYLPKKAADD